MDNRMLLGEHVDIAVGMAILGFEKKMSSECSILKTLYVSRVHPKLEYASCLWSVHVNRIERAQIHSICVAGTEMDGRA
jgi:hypothetical protein